MEKQFTTSMGSKHLRALIKAMKNAGKQETISRKSTRQCSNLEAIGLAMANLLHIAHTNKLSREW
jgi:hypothetical protein